MKKNKFLVLLTGLLIAGAAGAVVAAYSDKGESSITLTESHGDMDIDTVETRYITAYLGQYSKNVLLKVQTSTQYNTGRDGSTTQSVIEARSQKDSFATVLWKNTDAGGRVNYLNEEFIESISFGCCGDFDRHVIYTVATGQSPATYLNDDFFTITVPNSGLTDRYLAQIEDKTAPSTRNGQNYIGTVAYFDSTGRLSKVRFYAKVPSGWGTEILDAKIENLAGAGSKNSVRDNKLELWDSDGNKDANQAYQGFGISGHIYFENNDLSFTVPVKGDQIDASNIKTSPGLEFEVVP